MAEYLAPRSVDDTERRDSTFPATDFDRLDPVAARQWTEAINERMKDWTSPYDRYTTWGSYSKADARVYLGRKYDALVENSGGAEVPTLDEYVERSNGMSMVRIEGGHTRRRVMVSEEAVRAQGSPLMERDQTGEDTKVGMQELTHEDLHPAVDFGLVLEGLYATVLEDLNKIAGFDLSTCSPEQYAAWVKDNITGYMGMGHAPSIPEIFTEACDSYRYSMNRGVAPPTLAIQVTARRSTECSRENGWKPILNYGISTINSTKRWLRSPSSSIYPTIPMSSEKGNW